MAELASAAQRVAAALRNRIVAGALPPGTRLSEEVVRREHGVSRSTLREAFQGLIRERLLVHELSRGVFVRRLSPSDISDLYRVRRVVECGALDWVTTIAPAELRNLTAAVTAGEGAARAGKWENVAQASIRFHLALVALAGSERLDGIVSGILAEFRLAYGYMRDTQTFHAAYLKRHHGIVEALRSGNIAGATRSLDRYLRDAEAELLGSYYNDLPNGQS